MGLMTRFNSYLSLKFSLIGSLNVKNVLKISHDKANDIYHTNASVRIARSSQRDAQMRMPKRCHRNGFRRKRDRAATRGTKN